jgi:hypothetical protein
MHGGLAVADEADTLFHKRSDLRLLLSGNSHVNHSKNVSLTLLHRVRRPKKIPSGKFASYMGYERDCAQMVGVAST